jgi:hypothetical protein
MPFLGPGRGGDVAVGRPMSETPGLRPRVNRRCSKTRLCEASDEAGRWTGLVTCFAGGPARGNLVRLSLVDFPLNGGRMVSTLILVPLIVVPDKSDLSKYDLLG